MEIELLGNTVNVSGLIVGLYVFFIILVARWLCIWGEYHFTKKFWIFFLVFGSISAICSVFFENIILSSIFAITGFTFLWGINETIEQELRVKKGWFPKNPKR